MASSARRNRAAGNVHAELNGPDNRPGRIGQIEIANLRQPLLGPGYGHVLLDHADQRRAMPCPTWRAKAVLRILRPTALEPAQINRYGVVNNGPNDQCERTDRRLGERSP